MENGVEKFDPNTLMQGVKDRIKATFVSLIPDGKWDEMVQKEIDAFFNSEETLIFAEKDKHKQGSWHSTKYATLEIKQSPFRALVWEHCTEMTLKIIKDKITEDYFKDSWKADCVDDNKMTKIISEAAPIAAINFFKGLSYNMQSELRNAIQSMR